MGTTAIEWTGRRREDGTFEPGYSWSPWWGCTRVSAGCQNCYAADLAHRYRGLEYKRGVPRQLSKNWEQPLVWDRAAKRAGVRRKVFPSMCDVFDDEVPPEWRVRFFHLVSDARHLDWLILTKRPEKIRHFHGEPGTARSWPEGLPPNVWLGVSVENQALADERIPLLLQTPAAVRFLSVEPLLGPVDLARLTVFGGQGRLPHWNALNGDRGFYGGVTTRVEGGHPRVDWVIVGGESGPRRRPCRVEWVADLAAQCRAAGVACFVKQGGALRPGQQADLPDQLWALKEFPRV